MNDEHRDPWQKRPDETPKSWAAFRMYRDLGAGRSIAEVSKQIGHAYPSHVERWSRRYDWVARAHAWDESIDREYRSELLRHRGAMARRHARLAQGLQKKALEALNRLDPSDGR